MGPLLERLERRGAPLFVHPGSSPWERAPETTSASHPRSDSRERAPEAPSAAHSGSDSWERVAEATSTAHREAIGRATASGSADTAWWPALTGYVSSMNAAWHAFIDAGRPAHPNLRVVFALLAGGAPLHVERLAARGGPAERAIDAGLHYDISSYGPRAVEAVGRIVGVRQLVYGSDRPMVEPSSPSESVWAVAAAENGARIAAPLASADAQALPTARRREGAAA